MMGGLSGVGIDRGVDEFPFRFIGIHKNLQPLDQPIIIVSPHRGIEINAQFSGLNPAKQRDGIAWGVHGATTNAVCGIRIESIEAFEKEGTIALVSVLVPSGEEPDKLISEDHQSAGI